MPVTGYAYQWERCDSTGALSTCAPISGASAQTYTLTSADLGDTLRVQEKARNFYGTGAGSTSDPSGVVGEPPTSATPPAISGTATQGQVLIEAHGTWTQGPLTGYGYQWERCDAVGASCTAISGAVNQAYTLTSADVGSTIKVQETAINAYGTSAPATSAATSAVQAAGTVGTGVSAPPKFMLLGAPTASTTGVSFSLACQGAAGTACSGRVQLSTLEKLLGSKLLALSARRQKRHSKRVIVGQLTFALPAGQTKKLSVSLDATGKNLLTRFGKLPATLTISLLNTSPPTVIQTKTTIKKKRMLRKH
jgi:hypothetical protein